MIDPQTLLRQMFDAAVASAQPNICVPKHMPSETPRGRFIVIGAGKASAAMARAVEETWKGPLEGLVITRYGYSVPCEKIEIVEASHPVPDEAGQTASQRIRELVSGLTADDFVLCLISGGGSSLMTLPAEGLSLEDLQAANTALLRSGATITEMNCLRRHLSSINGGRLAAACHPAKLLTLMISDVPGDDPIDIASGPTVADPTTLADAQGIVDRYRLQLPDAVLHALKLAQNESIKPSDLRLASSEARIIAAPQMALEAAASVALKAGVVPYILGDSIEGEARDLGVVMSGIVRQVKFKSQPFEQPCILLSGGETTVTMRGQGRGGRNVEFLLSLMVALNGLHGVYAVAADTDGVDGCEEVAGAFGLPETLEKGRSLGLSARAELENNNAHGFFEAIGDQLVTGPTLTNVNDFRAILITDTRDLCVQ
ncbi:glycerate 2-kinase [Cohaesibacter sp. ES.047]|uniref:glycerate kinase type-2 family protein n=1 Tax=Cohaesibacter sp. ES.047 TaxID=1798205 RepID=UPI000BB6FAA5|nr:glycerate kinase [Cohaesibacter sp. ES.047]SNY90306.1 glycerate 2-kinase [Cohaesibacter sp. ES.047]